MATCLRTAVETRLTVRPGKDGERITKWFAEWADKEKFTKGSAINLMAMPVRFNPILKRTYWSFGESHVVCWGEIILQWWCCSWIWVSEGGRKRRASRSWDGTCEGWRQIANNKGPDCRRAIRWPSIFLFLKVVIRSFPFLRCFFLWFALFRASPCPASLFFLFLFRVSVIFANRPNLYNCTFWLGLCWEVCSTNSRTAVSLTEPTTKNAFEMQAYHILRADLSELLPPSWSKESITESSDGRWWFLLLPQSSIRERAINLP